MFDILDSGPENENPMVGGARSADMGMGPCSLPHDVRQAYVTTRGSEQPEPWSPGTSCQKRVERKRMEVNKAKEQPKKNDAKFLFHKLSLELWSHSELQR